MPGPNDCQECGMLIEDPGEYHPWALCALMKAGRGSLRARTNLYAVLLDARSTEPHMRSRVDEFLARVEAER